MWDDIIPILVMINPIGLFIYLTPIRKALSHKDYLKVVLKATIISFFILLLFFFFGNFLLQVVFRINFESFRIFGGILIFSFAYLFLIKGQKALIRVKVDLDDMASEIALPFMVGAGSISLTMLLSYKVQQSYGVIVLIVTLLLALLIILLLTIFRDRLPNRTLKIGFDKNMEILLRLNGFFIGAIGINMVLSGITNMFLM